MSQPARADILLASSSPRRVNLLEQMGLTFDVMSPDVDESVMPDEAPHAYVERLSRSKAAAGLAHGSNQVVIAADTIVTLDDAILGKPSGPDDGKQMLLALAGRAHRVLTGLTVATQQEAKSQVVASNVWFRAISEQEAAAYWQTGEPSDKAGSYGLQGIGSIFVQRVEGSPSAVIGLPVEETETLLTYFGVDTWSGRIGRASE
ncbi:MAG: Maf family protein [Pseudomonadales bacterium]